MEGEKGSEILEIGVVWAGIKKSGFPTGLVRKRPGYVSERVMNVENRVNCITSPSKLKL